MKIRLLMLGKTRRPEMNAVLADYAKRIGRSCPIESTEVRDGEAALKQLDADRAPARRRRQSLRFRRVRQVARRTAGSWHTRDCFRMRRRRRLPRSPARTR